MDTRGPGQVEQVVRVRGKNVIPILGEADDSRVDGVRGTRAPHEHPRAPAQLVADRGDIHVRHQLGE